MDRGGYLLTVWGQDRLWAGHPLLLSTRVRRRLGRAVVCGRVGSEAVPVGANGVHDGVGDFLPKVTRVEARLAH
jgi:hypothetical protein